MRILVKNRIVREARERLAEYGLDLSDCKVEVLDNDDVAQADVRFTRPNGAEITLSNVWYVAQTGEILQAGTQYGTLTL